MISLQQHQRQMQGACSGGLWSAGAAARASGGLPVLPAPQHAHAQQSLPAEVTFFSWFLPALYPRRYYYCRPGAWLWLLFLCAEALLLPQVSGSGGELSSANTWPHPYSFRVELLPMGVRV